MCSPQFLLVDCTLMWGHTKLVDRCVVCLAKLVLYTLYNTCNGDDVHSVKPALYTLYSTCNSSDVHAVQTGSVHPCVRPRGPATRKTGSVI